MTAPETPKPPSVSKPSVRKPSAKTLARSLAAYLKANNVSGATTVTDLMGKIKSSIVQEEVGVSLDGWEN